MQRGLPLGITLVLGTGCSDSPLSPHEQGALANAREKWEAAGLAAYTFEYQVICFCAVYWARISVGAGEVAEVVYADSVDVALDTEGWPTIDDLFSRIDRLDGGLSPNVREVDVEFDPTLGYPTRIRVGLDRNIEDGGATYMTRNLLAAP